MKNEHLTRQMDLIPLAVLGEPITIIGAGAIGSWTCLALAKMGFNNITVMDHDVVDIVNLSSQFYPKYTHYHPFHPFEKPKVEVLAQLIRDFVGMDITAKPQLYTGGKFQGIVISAVDSMLARRLIWEEHQNSAARAIIDPRMGAESALLYVMKPSDAEDRLAYEKTLYTDDDAVQERCTAKATIYTANILSGLVCKAVKDLLTKPDYLRMVQWDIAANDPMMWTKPITKTSQAS